MRRLTVLAVVLLVVLAGLVAGGILTVRVNVPSTDSVSASPFWREVAGEASTRRSSPRPAGRSASASPSP